MSTKATTPIRVDHIEQPFLYKSMEMIEAAHPAKTEFPHRHSFFSILFVRAGSGVHHIDFQNHEITPDTFYLLSPEQIHYFELTSLPKGEVLLFTPDFLEQYIMDSAKLQEMDLFFNCNETLPIQLLKTYRAQVDDLFEQMKSNFTSSESDRLDMIGVFLKTLLLYLKRFKNTQLGVSQDYQSRKSQIVKTFKKDLEAQFKTFHKVSHYAARQHLSSVYLNEVLKGETGIGAKEFIQNRIILEAKRLVFFSDWNMKEIAYELGFDDAAHFSKVFKKRTGLTFSQFKIRSQNT